MTREEAIDQLSSASTHLRRRASRFLARNAEEADLAAIRLARNSESDAYVHVGLDQAIARLARMGEPAMVLTDEESDGESLDAKQIYSRAVEWVAGLLLHELSAPIGLLAYETSREIPNYAESRTKVLVGKLQMAFEAIEQLKKASATPKPEGFDLSALIDEIASIEFAECAESIAKYGPRPLLLTSDQSLLRFAICNGLRNAVEAVQAINALGTTSVVLAWGKTDVDYWVSIIDKGPGLTVPVESIFKIGKTTKDGHSGFGLAIATAAIHAVGGTVTLEPANGGGAKYELRWE